MLGGAQVWNRNLDVTFKELSQIFSDNSVISPKTHIMRKHLCNLSGLRIVVPLSGLCKGKFSLWYCDRTRNGDSFTQSEGWARKRWGSSSLVCDSGDMWRHFRPHPPTSRLRSAFGMHFLPHVGRKKTINTNMTTARTLIFREPHRKSFTNGLDSVYKIVIYIYNPFHTPFRSTYTYIIAKCIYKHIYIYIIHSFLYSICI